MKILLSQDRASHRQLMFSYILRPETRHAMRGIGAPVGQTVQAPRMKRQSLAQKWISFAFTQLQRIHHKTLIKYLHYRRRIRSYRALLRENKSMKWKMGVPILVGSSAHSREIGRLKCEGGTLVAEFNDSEKITWEFVCSMFRGARFYAVGGSVVDKVHFVKKVVIVGFSAEAEPAPTPSFTRQLSMSELR